MWQLQPKMLQPTELKLMETGPLKLYVWHNVLADYSDGIAFALASSPEHAKALLRASGTIYNDEHWNGILLDGVAPEIHDTPYGCAIYGGN